MLLSITIALWAGSLKAESSSALITYYTSAVLSFPMLSSSFSLYHLSLLNFSTLLLTQICRCNMSGLRRPFRPRIITFQLTERWSLHLVVAKHSKPCKLSSPEGERWFISLMLDVLYVFGEQTLVLAYVTIPAMSRLSSDILSSPACLLHYSIREVIVRRFIPARMRD